MSSNSIHLMAIRLKLWVIFWCVQIKLLWTEKEDNLIQPTQPDPLLRPKQIQLLLYFDYVLILFILKHYIFIQKKCKKQQ